MVDANSTQFEYKIRDPETGTEYTVTGLTVKEIIDFRLTEQLISSIRRIKHG